jgi:SAM-dependent methyltransferase
MRFETTRIFNEWFTENCAEIDNVAVVGGTSSDAELEVIRRVSPKTSIHYFGIENTNADNNFQHLDLNLSVNIQHSKFDLVLCSQVLEHVWNLNQVFQWFASLVKKDGYLWVNCPASNIAHGSPEYYSAGYTPEYISNNLKLRNFEIEMEIAFGSKRYYFMTHILKFWPTQHEHDHPVSKYNFQPGTLLGIARKFLLDLPGRVLSLFFSNKIEQGIDTATESIVLAKLKA